MNRSTLKNFAVNGRKKLIEGVKKKAFQYGIPEKGPKDSYEYEDGFRVNGTVYSRKEQKQRDELRKKIREKGFDQVMEEVAYTWFNRFIAIRFMEVNDYLPSGVRVLSPKDNSREEPDIIRRAQYLPMDIDKELIYKYKTNSDTEGLFKYLLVIQCNELHKILPQIFEEIEDYTELLLPDNLLSRDSVIHDLVNDIPEEDFKDQVQIIGWLYQYYISEKKDEVFKELKSNKKIKKENIPAATQLFTPDWIVRYMLENSLGRLWIENYPEQDELKKNWKYYIEEADQEEEVKEKFNEVRERNRINSPEEITIFDPAMGSGHILVYAFDILYEIYKTNGYFEEDIPKTILENNLFGSEVDDRAEQLSYFALMMKARSKNKNIFKERINLNITSIKETNELSSNVIEFITKNSNNKPKIREELQYIKEKFTDAKNYGSMLKLRKIEDDLIEEAISKIRSLKNLSIEEGIYLNEIEKILIPIIKYIKIMNKKYNIVCTNPPYMGSKGMNKELSQYLKTNYKDSKSDMFSVFLDYFLEWIKENGFLSIITMQSWMFLSSYEKLRIKIFNNSSIDSMIHLGTRAFEEIDGEVVQTTSFVIKKVKIINYKANFIRLVDFNNAEEKRIKTMEAIQNPDVDYRYKSYTKDFNKIPGSPIAYWVSDKVREIFQNNKSLGEIASPRQGLATADNKRFLRHWHEVDFKNIGFDFKNREEAKESDLKWFPYQKGGDFRKWYGNNEYLINWKNDGREIKNYEKSVIRNLTYYFKKGITWSAISSSTISMRINNDGFVFDSKGPKLFSKENYDYILGLNNNIISNNFLKILSPTLDFNQGCISKIPFIKPSNQNILNKIDSLVEENIEISKKDWDSFEISWDFQKHPLLLIDELTNSNKSSLIKTQFKKWEEFTQKQFSKLKENEEELNKIFINIYGLNEEMSPNIDGKDITISKADKTQEIKSFLSYAVGCMVGRYSLDIPGLVYAGGEYDPEKYKTYEADDDNIIPVLEDEYFDDDIVVRFKKFVKKVFGEETLNENLLYIAETLGKKSNETPLQTIRKYFTKEFYKDHVQIYKKKPIYWMFNSGKNNGFKVLIYMHRYEPKILAVMRTKYLHALQGIYERRRKELDKIIQIETNERNKTKAKREMNEIDKKIKECIEYDKVLKDVADHGIEIDLDGGVDVNYEKFQNKDIGEGKKKNLLTKK